MNLGGAVRINKCGLIFLLAAAFIIILYTFGGRGGQGSSEDAPGGYYSGFMNSAGIQFPSFSIIKDHGKVSLKALLVASIDVAQRGGQEVVAVRKSAAQLQEDIKGKTKEGVKDSATQGDYRSHRVMYYGLRKAFPGVKVISEEHTDAPQLSDVTMPNMEDDEISMVGDDILNAEDVSIWIDPLDATKEYTENMVEFVTTMVGVAVKGKPILGVIHRPFQEETYWAVAGYGNSPNLNKAAVEQLSQPDANSISKKESSKVRLIVSRSHAGNVKKLAQDAFGGSKDSSVEIITAAGAGYKVLEVIKDQADAYVHVTAIKKWDLCAGYALISAMGGSMSTLNGESIDFSADSEPLNTKGILAFMKSTDAIQKLKTIQINDTS